jgi:hypothetical protein
VQGRIEFVQVPAQPLLRPAPLVDEVVAMIDEQFQLVQRLLVLARPFESRLLEGGARDRERVDRVRLPARPAASALRRGQSRRHPHEPLACTKHCPLERSRDMPAVLERPEPISA